jgi:hypothetical protein
MTRVENSLANTKWLETNLKASAGFFARISTLVINDTHEMRALLDFNT